MMAPVQRPGPNAMTTPTRKTLKRDGAKGRAVHDVGGLEFGAVDRSEHDLALWEKRTDALLILLVGPKKGAFKIDAMRRVIEDYGQQDYDRIGYYDKWIRALRNLVVEQEIVTPWASSCNRIGARYGSKLPFKSTKVCKASKRPRI